MDSLIDRGHALMNRIKSPAKATTVRYIRGAAVISDALEAGLSNQQIEQVTGAGVAFIGRQFTWDLKRDGLFVDGAVDKPRRDDRIEWVRSGQTFVFVVMPELGSPESNAVDPRSDWIPASVKLIEVR